MKPASYPGHSHFLPYLLNRATSLINVGFNAALRAQRMTLTQWRVLAFLHEHDGLGVSALAGATVTDQATLSRALTGMERRSLVKRRVRSADNRFVEVHLTATGRKQFDALLEVALELEASAVRGMAKQEIEQLRASLAKLAETIDGE
jgi:DNA-binding MarR family transcriptional regulator